MQNHEGNMASKHTRECPTPSVIGEIQIQSSGRTASFLTERLTLFEM